MSEPPNWKDMPNPIPILTLSWEDVYEPAYDYTGEKLGRPPTKEEINEIFHQVYEEGIDCEHGTFWNTIDYVVREYYEDIYKDSREGAKK